MSSDATTPQAGPTADMAPLPTGGRRWSPRGAREAIQPSRPPEPPMPPRRPHGRGFLGSLSAFLTFLVFAAVVVAGAVLYLDGLVSGAGPLKQDKVVFIPRGNGPAEIGDILLEEGVITNSFAFQALHLIKGRNALKAGEYQFKETASLTDVLDTLIRGRSIEHAITVPEGLTSEQIVGRLRENEILVGEIRNIPREGALLPDTYRFERGTSREQLLLRMENAQKRLLQEIWQRRTADLPIRSAADLVTLASIVEKETGRADERPRVASVFVNRLNRGMRLESDPTIIYGLVGGKGTLGRGILASEIRQPTPYNTYVINGLPPGPIANPGRAAMEATANPSRTRDIFFVADGTGGHAFAETYEQHQRNVARWRQIESGGAAPAPAVPPPAAAPAAPVQTAPRAGQRSDLELPPQQPVPARAEAPAARTPSALQTTVGGTPFQIPQLSQEALAAFNAPPAIDQDVPMASQSGIESYPVAPGRRQSMQRSAQQAGAGQPTAFAPAGDSEPAPFVAQPASPETGVPGARRTASRAFDAVEGTARDPLRNKTFDLNSPKTVPVLR